MLNDYRKISADNIKKFNALFFKGDNNHEIPDNMQLQHMFFNQIMEQCSNNISRLVKEHHSRHEDIYHKHINTAYMCHMVKRIVSLGHVPSDDEMLEIMRCCMLASYDGPIYG